MTCSPSTDRVTLVVAAALVVLFQTAIATAGPPLPETAADGVKGKPNIVFILADDLGWGSVGCYGADANLVRTPAIDRLAREGRRFTDATAPASVCSPTRYAVLTGRYCWRTSLKFGTLGTASPLHIETGRATIPAMLHRQGYATGFVGKWHLGFGAQSPTDYTTALRPGPLELGLDFFHGIASNHGDGTGVYLGTEDDPADGPVVKVAGLRSARLAPFGPSFYGKNGGGFMGLDAPQRVDEEVMPHLTDEAVGWIAKQPVEKPFCLFFAPVAIHEPITPSRELKGTSRAGNYGDWIHELDRSVGRILEELDRRGLAQDTLVVLTSDNGGENRYGIRAWAGSEQSANKAAIAAGLRMNGHWRAGKYSIYEGGLRVPLIARWPAAVPAGTACDLPISLVDMFATCAAIVDADLPPPAEGAEDSFDARSLLVDADPSTAIRPVVVGHSGDGIFSIRQGPWKWIEGIPAKIGKKSQGHEPRAELYDLESDPGESRDVAADHPDIVLRLRTELERIRQAGHSRKP